MSSFGSQGRKFTGQHVEMNVELTCWKIFLPFPFLSVLWQKKIFKMLDREFAPKTNLILIGEISAVFAAIERKP